MGLSCGPLYKCTKNFSNRILLGIFKSFSNYLSESKIPTRLLFVRENESTCRGPKSTSTNTQGGSRILVINRIGGNLLTLCKRGQLEQALQAVDSMYDEGSDTCSSYITLLHWCTNVKDVAQGKIVHSHMIERGLKTNVTVETNLVQMYSQCNSIIDARQVFNQVLTRDLCVWNAIILAYSNHGQENEVLLLVCQMEEEGVVADEATFSSILKACASLGNSVQGRHIHDQILKSKIRNVLLVNALIDMYAKCGKIEDACWVFKNTHVRTVVSWNVMIAGYIKHNRADAAFKAFHQMEQEGIMPNKRTFVSLLTLCNRNLNFEEGKQIHHHMVKFGIQQNAFLQSSLVNMYIKCGSIESARAVFDRTHGRDVVTWTAMIAGCAAHGYATEALNLYQQMKEDGALPNEISLVSVLNACASITALEQGKEVHAHIIKCRFDDDIFIGSALIDVYAKCGSIEDAKRVFDNMPKRDAVSWTAMVVGYAQHGYSKNAHQLFECMCHEGVKMNHVTFLNILSACSHAGLVDDAQWYFCSMSQDHDIMPRAEHYACMVDLLGRAGRLKEAENFIQKMPAHPPTVVWMALLGACRICSDIELAKLAVESILQLEPQNTACLVILANMHAAAE